MNATMSNDLLKKVLGEKTNEVARLRKYIEKLEIYSPENEWSQPEWRKLIGSKEENEDPETLFKLYQFRLAPAPEEPVIQDSRITESDTSATRSNKYTITKLDPNTKMIFREGKGWQVLNQEEENQRNLDKIEEHLYWLELNSKHIEENELAKIRDVLTNQCLSYLLTEIKKLKRK